MNRRDFGLHMAAGWGLGLAACARTPEAAGPDVHALLEQTLQPLMQQHGIPGMAAGVACRGQRWFVHRGVAVRQTQQPVSAATLFEIGSVSKAFTGLLGAQAHAAGRLDWNDRASRHLPALQGSSFDRVSLLQLATYTAGGLPLQVPDEVQGQEHMLAYYRGWQPRFPPGTVRQYSNASIGLFGHLAARSLGMPFAQCMEQRLFAALGLSSTHLQVPPERLPDYAWGERDGRPVRVAPGLWDAEAYGVKTTAADLLRFVELNMDPQGLPPLLRQAVAATQAGRYRVGAMSQGLGWELYDAHASLDELLAGNSTDMALKPHPVVQQDATAMPSRHLLVNKTGSTNGFGAYAAFLPAHRVGLVLLANKNYPTAARVQAAHRVLSALAFGPAAHSTEPSTGPQRLLRP